MIKYLTLSIFILILFSLSLPSLAQVEQEEEVVFSVIENMPEFEGGEKEMTKFLMKNLNYPEQAREKGVMGNVYVSFVVNKEGKVTDAKVIKGIGSGCDEESLRVVNLMPDWKPATQRGKAVKCRMNLPIRYNLDLSTDRKEKKKKKRKQN